MPTIPKCGYLYSSTTNKNTENLSILGIFDVIYTQIQVILCEKLLH